MAEQELLEKWKRRLGLSASYFCSVCCYNMDEDEYLDRFSSYNYCPNCGAKMDGGNE